MKPEELMIGDWFSFNGKAGQINIIDTWDNEVSYFNGDAEGVLSFGFDDIEPIPLTTEILKKNGFKKELYSDSSFIYGDGVHPIDKVFVAMDFRRDGTARTITIVNFRCSYINNALPNGLYVHELQHALRLCCLNELANNFKI